MKKLLAIALCLCMLLPAIALAASAELSSTKAFLKWADRNDIVYEYVGIDDSYERVRVENEGEAFDYTIQYFFDVNEENASLRVWDVFAFDEDDFSKACVLCNTLNGDYKYVSFFAEDDNTITACIDLIFRDNDVDAIMAEATDFMVRILDDAYPTIKSTLK